ncbi:sulfate adenylyltransferase subunit 1 [Breznakibacter xylanolyticus]|uniref:sulfate adenylyltransferase n=1 Tax=Breznakibacter xylanolyticus TaxID=990 RepID=A0A2W7NY87_9BACT|nr:GTP-binding protein [Breznakibacter xylanolyticus]PZX16152.1 sulfate adenylyltransferase subunit 1 [Breznakibacter xylanolyticus]
MNGKQSGYLDMELLRFTTAGSVDDGKSTLIGRLLYDSKAIFDDQLEAIERASERIGNEEVNLALLTDGLRAEREQGITIDVAYRYFATPKRKFIIADTPGHIQYTRNMVTGASTANVALILVDARQGVLEQTLRHAYIASLLQIPHIIVCVNKMDLVDFSQATFDAIQKDLKTKTASLPVKDIRYVPISALLGDNVVDASQNMPWYPGPTLMSLLENIYISDDINHQNFRFPVQYVVRPQAKDWHDYRGYAGRVVSGSVKVGDKVTVLPSGFSSTVKTIDFYKETLQEASAPQSVTITLNDDIDISRGDMLVKELDHPQVNQDIDMMICWFNERKLVPRGKYIIRHTSAEAKCMIKEVVFKVNINTMKENSDDKEVGMNDIARIAIRTTKPLFFDSYQMNRETGSIILVDEGTNETVAAGMII